MDVLGEFSLMLVLNDIFLDFPFIQVLDFILLNINAKTKTYFNFVSKLGP